MSGKETELSILVLDDDPVIRNLLRSILKQKCQVFAVEKPSVAFKILDNETIDIMICDFRLPEMDGLKVIEKIRAEYPSVEIIMISSEGDMDIVIKAMRLGAIDFFRKPFTPPEIWIAIERTQKFAQLNASLSQVKSQNENLRKQLKSFKYEMVGKSTLMSNVDKMMQQVAKSPTTSVLIIGESGTGKELVARGIHNYSKRNNESFGAVNMGAIPENLFESEFFGHKKGSFTGAVNDKSGWFESINRGTLFLDEIGEMNQSLQVKLLRVLEDKKYTKVGTQSETDYDIRIIAATNKNEKELSDGKSFRLDLFHRLSTFIIKLPPLRERRDDIEPLCNHFLGLLSKEMGSKVSSINKEAIALLKSYSFPGNIRELRNLMERALIICEENELGPEHFKYSLSSVLDMNEETKLNSEYDLTLVERNTIINALKQVNYNKAEAARLLNLEWNALYRRIQKHKIEIPK